MVQINLFLNKLAIVVHCGVNPVLWLWIGMQKNNISPKELAFEFGVTTRTVRRWANAYKWPVVRINSRVIFYPVRVIERTFGIKLGGY